jgi:hypothetical protein
MQDLPLTASAEQQNLLSVSSRLENPSGLHAELRIAAGTARILASLRGAQCAKGTWGSYARCPTPKGGKSERVVEVLCFDIRISRWA